MLPIPEGWIASSLILHPGPLPSGPKLVQGLTSRVSALNVDAPRWSSLGESTSYAHGELRSGLWAWQLIVIDGALASEQQRTIDAYINPEVRSVLHRHRAHAFIFLTEVPEICDRLEPLQQLAATTWAWLDLGATAVIWPDSQRASTARELALVDPILLGPDDVHRFIGVEQHPADRTGRVWFNTRGQSQFGLPELACSLPGPIGDAERDAVHSLFTSLAPYFLEMGGPLEPGNTIEIEGHVWQADDKVPRFLQGRRTGFQVYSLVEGRDRGGLA